MALKKGNAQAVYNSAGITLADGNETGLFVNASGQLLVASAPSSYPSSATPITATSASVANASAVATLAGVAAKTTYITGFQATAGGSTVGSDQTLTVAGVITGTMNYTFTFPAGAVVGANLIVPFPMAIPASAVNTAIVVTLPAGGAGNTNATVAAQGFQL